VTISLSQSQRAWLSTTAAAAYAAQHIFPFMAACEAALESGYGTSGLAIRYHNLFGMKQHAHPVYGTVVLPTKEVIRGSWVEIDASWVDYPDLEACFFDRMATLTRLSSAFPNYALALAAADPVSYVTAVSKTWSTDPDRATKVISIYSAYEGGAISDAQITV
jgi:flagellum-specific peptidoglycan hydrolase FlgJ